MRVRPAGAARSARPRESSRNVRASSSACSTRWRRERRRLERRRGQELVVSPKTSSARCSTRSGAAAARDFRFHTFSNRLQRPPNGNRRPATSKRSMRAEQLAGPAGELAHRRHLGRGQTEAGRWRRPRRRRRVPGPAEPTPSAPSNSGLGGITTGRPTLWAKAWPTARFRATPPCRNTFLPTARGPLTG